MFWSGKICTGCRIIEEYTAAVRLSAPKLQYARKEQPQHAEDTRPVAPKKLCYSCNNAWHYVYFSRCDTCARIDIACAKSKSKRPQPKKCKTEHCPHYISVAGDYCHHCVRVQREDTKLQLWEQERVARAAEVRTSWANTTAINKRAYKRRRIFKRWVQFVKSKRVSNQDERLADAICACGGDKYLSAKKCRNCIDAWARLTKKYGHAVCRSPKRSTGEHIYYAETYSADVLTGGNDHRWQDDTWNSFDDLVRLYEDTLGELP